MQLRNLLTDDRAVSPVIGVILMVAITVILAAVIGTFVLGLGDQISESAPQASFSFEFDMDGTPKYVNITHEGGATIDNSTLSIDGSQGGVQPASGVTDWNTDWEGTVQAGDEIIYKGVDSGEVVRVIWTNPSGGSTNTIARATAPQ